MPVLMDSVGKLAVSLGCAGVLAALILHQLCVRRSIGSESMQAIAGQIRRGAMTYLRAQYGRIALFALGVIVLLAWWYDIAMAGAFLLGVLTSAMAGFIGMRAATQANVRTVAAARDDGERTALSVAFTGGAVMGMAVAGLGLLGLGILYVLIGEQTDAVSQLWGFSMGASLVALFARVGGGIYTKAADVGADLVGKVEKNIPEDDPRNPGVIADNVGDNVGDIAGMGADIFESYVGAAVAAVTIAATMGAAEVRTLLGPDVPASALLVLPLVLQILGLTASLTGILSMSGWKRLRPDYAVAACEITTSLIFLILAAGVVVLFGFDLNLFWAVLAGNIAGIAIGRISTYYTSGRPVYRIALAAKTGPATNIITGIAAGLESCAGPLIVLSVAIFAAYEAAGLYGIALAAVGMLATAGMTMTVDASGPISDNAGGIAELSRSGPSVRAITDRLDALGNTTAAIGKGFAIGSATLTASALFVAYQQAVSYVADDLVMTISDPLTLIGALLGSVVVLIAASLTMNAVGAAAIEMVTEIRRQFHEIAGLMEGTSEPDTERCIRISTDAALNRMIVPGVIAFFAPVVVGFVLGPVALGGMLLGSLLIGTMLALFMANAGGAWDNAKKAIERGDIEGEAKGTPAHAAAVIGDTVGDPFKDTTGPSMNILIKLIAIVALVIAPIIF
jgi:K(+)-stimulated pyrophosphate-energized sodium pump